MVEMRGDAVILLLDTKQEHHTILFYKRNSRKASARHPIYLDRPDLIKSEVSAFSEIQPKSTFRNPESGYGHSKNDYPHSSTYTIRMPYQNNLPVFSDVQEERNFGVKRHNLFGSMGR